MHFKISNSSFKRSIKCAGDMCSYNFKVFFLKYVIVDILQSLAEIQQIYICAENNERMSRIWKTFEQKGSLLPECKQL